jgi:hypothetical protein
MTLSLLIKRGCRKLDAAGCVVATTNGMGMALAIAEVGAAAGWPVPAPHQVMHTRAA